MGNVEFFLPEREVLSDIEVFPEIAAVQYLESTRSQNLENPLKMFFCTTVDMVTPSGAARTGPRECDGRVTSRILHIRPRG